jgi:hypothetical protein
MSLGVHGLHAVDVNPGKERAKHYIRPGGGEEEIRKRMSETRFMSSGVHGLHAGDVDREKRKPTSEGLKAKEENS